MIFGQERKVISVDTLKELCNVGPTAIQPKKKEIRTVSHVELKSQVNIISPTKEETVLKVENAKVEISPTKTVQKTINNPTLKRLNISNGGEDILWL